MNERHEHAVFERRAPLEESRGGWALFGRLLIWATRNNRTDDDPRRLIA